MSKPDKIFGERLANHAVTPSSAAWEKVNASLAKKNNKAPWLRWAAVLIPILFLIGLSLLNKPEPSPAITTDSQSVPPPSIDKQTPLVNRQHVAAAVPIVKRNRPVAIKEATAATPIEEQKNEPLTTEAQTTPEAITITTPLIEPVLEKEAVVAQQTKPIVLEYTLATIPWNKMEDENKKPSSIQKVVEFTQTVKHSDPLSEIRTMKEGLMALDFRKKSVKKN